MKACATCIIVHNYIKFRVLETIIKKELTKNKVQYFDIDCSVYKIKNKTEQ